MMTIRAMAPPATTTAATMCVTSSLVFPLRRGQGLDSPIHLSQGRGDAMADRKAGAGQAETEPRPAAVTFVTTEHLTLQGARSSTIAEATGRATMFLGAVSGGLVALGLIATAAGVRTAFYAFALILLPTLALIGLWRHSTGCWSQGSRTSAMQAGSRGCTATTSAVLTAVPCEVPAVATTFTRSQHGRTSGCAEAVRIAGRLILRAAAGRALRRLRPARPAPGGRRCRRGSRRRRRRCRRRRSGRCRRGRTSAR